MSCDVLEIACDESGAEGENLIGAINAVFAHAGVRFGVAEAAERVREIRARAPSPVQEYKAGHILREKNRATLEWVLGPSGPLEGHAHVHLTEKRYFAVSRLAGLLLDDPDPGMFLDERARDLATTLYLEGGPAFGAGAWESFLRAFNAAVRVNNGRNAEASVDALFALAAELRPAAPGGRMGAVADLLRAARPNVERLRALHLADPAMPPALDPLLPAIAYAVARWGEGAAPVLVVHDRQTALTDERVDRVAKAVPAVAATARMAGLRLAASHADPRVQLADLLAGAARRIAQDELAGRGDRRLTELLRPYVDRASVWGDPRSRALLHPDP